MNFQAFACVGFLDKLVPAPAKLVAAEQGDDQRSQRQQVVGDDEVPQIQPCSTGSKGNKTCKHAVAQSGSQGSQQNADAANDAALGTGPSGHFTDASQNVFEHCQFGGECGKDHEQEEQAAPDLTAVHVDKNSCHGIEQKAGARADFHTVGGASGEDDEASGNGNKEVQANDVDALTHEGAFFANVAAEDGHGANAKGQSEERLVHSSNDHFAVDLLKIGNQIELQTFSSALEGEAANGQNDHQNQQSAHHVLGDAFQTALQIEAQDGEADDNGNQQVSNIDLRIGYHRHKAQGLIVAGDKLHKVIDHPAGDHGVEAHQAHIAEQSQVAVDVPFLALLLQLLIHADGAGLRGATQCELHDHNRKTQYDQAEDVDQDKSAAAVLTGHPGEFPDVAAANGAACAEQNKTEAAAKAFSAVVVTTHNISPYSTF